MCRMYSTQKTKTVTISTILNKPEKEDNWSNVSKKVTIILPTMIIVIKISNARLILLLLSPI